MSSCRILGSVGSDNYFLLIIVLRLIQKNDFFEGVKSVLIDKNHKPRWTHESVNEIS